MHARMSWFLPAALLALAACGPSPIPLHTLNEQLAPGLTAEQCLATFGDPIHNFGAGEPIYQYPVEEGGSVLLTFTPTLESAVYAPPNSGTQQLFPK